MHDSTVQYSHVMGFWILDSGILLYVSWRWEVRVSMIMLFGIMLKLLLVLVIMVEGAIFLVIVNRVLHS